MDINLSHKKVLCYEAFFKENNIFSGVGIKNSSF